MSPVTHFLAGWVIANAGRFNRRERTVITIAAVVPDIDGLGIIPELLTRHSQHPLLWFSQFHHSLHTLLFAVIIGVLSFFLSGRKWMPAAFAFFAFHVHLFEDFVGGARTRWIRLADSLFISVQWAVDLHVERAVEA
jgi:inner membrane protein